MRRKFLHQWLYFLIVLGYNGWTVSLAQDGMPGISSSNSGPTAFNGININQLLGAERFYAADYTGTRSIVAAIEGAVVRTNHLTMSNVTELVYGTGVPNTDFGTNHNHPTSVTHAMSGAINGSVYSSSNYYGFGIAYGAETWSGAIAAGFATNGSYLTTWSSIASPYSRMLISGVGGRTVDIVNSSWWFTEPSGIRRDTIGVDGLAFQSGKLLVNIAGNAGPGTNTVSGFGAGYNGITVGALGTDSESSPYETVSNSSSRGPNQFALATGSNSWTTIAAATARRAAVDIVAPGQNLTLARPSGGTNWYGFNSSGTSFAAPIVAGGAGLLVDAGRDLYSTSESIDARVVKAVLMNSASKMPGWNNGQSLVDGMLTTDQALDFNQGAGRMNLDRAFDQYVAFASNGQALTTDVAGTERGDLGDVGIVGWDFGVVDVLGTNTYYFDRELAAGSELTATLSWFVDRNYGSLSDFSGFGERHFGNLDLRVFSFDNLVDRNPLSVIAQSISLYNTAEHLSFTIDSGGYYGIEVQYTNSHWNFVNNTEVAYGLAWFGTAVPEPGSWMILAISCCILAVQRRQRLSVRPE